MRMPLGGLVLVVAMPFCAPVAAAFDYNQSIDCSAMDKLNNYEMGQCVGRSVDVADFELNRAYKALMDKVGDDEKSFLLPLNERGSRGGIASVTSPRLRFLVTTKWVAVMEWRGVAAAIT